MNDPGRVIIAGDWHGNFGWASSQLPLMREAVPDEKTLVVLHLGDWGLWPGSEFTDKIGELAASLGIKIFVTPGNHEDYTQIDSQRYWSIDGIGSNRPVTVLDRGTRWQWHGRTWLSVGGAASPDQRFRLPGVSWWPGEELTEDEVDSVIADGITDVLLTHDVGAVVPLDLHPWPPVWGEAARSKCDAHRDRVDRLAAGVRPSRWLFGHYHMFSDQTVKAPWGEVKATGLDYDDNPMNWGVLDARTLEFSGFNSR
jgi:Calcineurin-like phosphoesterase